MVKLSAGEKKKLLIIDTCKKLFYRKGYSNTTYDDICSAADIPPGSITYHFDGKRGIATAIESEFERENKTYIEKVCGDKYSKTLLMVIENFNMWHRNLDDENLRRYLLDVSGDRVPNQSAVDAVKHFYRCVMDDQGIDSIDDKELTLIAASQIGMSDSLFLSNAMNPADYDCEYLARFSIRFFMRQIGIPDAKIQELIEEGYEIYRSLPIDNRYFAEFAYDDKYVVKVE